MMEGLPQKGEPSLVCIQVEGRDVVCIQVDGRDEEEFQREVVKKLI